ncbi:2-hydroxymuconate tautomerase family protein [Azonexus sp.]|uniref:tautomerase family protein n=1 Tax=Azonexus sp. TaxID=1872668 RepID=UPI0027B92B27|nr:2-hydroxymuconate tautomerase family protein [Azonexus sp.]
MPIIEMHLLEGRSVEKKRKAVAAMTAALVEALEVQPEQVRILITEHSVEHFSVGGQTVGQRNAAHVD